MIQKVRTPFWVQFTLFVAVLNRFCFQLSALTYYDSNLWIIQTFIFMEQEPSQYILAL